MNFVKIIKCIIIELELSKNYNNLTQENFAFKFLQSICTIINNYNNNNYKINL